LLLGKLAMAASDPGVSVSKLALEHQFNTNMVFKWRRDLRAGLLESNPRTREYIDSFYNRQRRHSRLGNVPPAAVC
jgi:transposase-like protein